MANDLWEQAFEAAVRDIEAGRAGPAQNPLRDKTWLASMRRHGCDQGGKVDRRIARMTWRAGYMAAQRADYLLQ